MGALNLSEWHKLPISLSELCINTTLRCGQSFRWRKSDAGVWSIALYNRILSVHQDPNYLYYRAIPGPAHNSHAPPTPPSSQPPCLPDASMTEDEELLQLVKHYFNLSHDLGALYKSWSAADPNFASKAPKFTGVRILRQPAWEALVGFICSSNNNIARITQMVHKLCVHYGPLVGHLGGDGEEGEGSGLKKEEEIEEEALGEQRVPYHDFPLPEALARPGVEAHLRELGFGYRAKYIYQTACMVAGKEEGWLDGLRNPEAPVFGGKAGEGEAWKVEGRDGYRAAHEALLELQGVGPKVADCVSLMGLGWGEAVPVDTHVWQIAVRDYRFGGKGGKNATMTKGMYEAVGNKFRTLWGKEAGWAHSVLFTADLKAFSERLVAKQETVEVKKEDEEERVVSEKKVLQKAIKREHEDGVRQLIEVQERVTRSKRRRRN